MIDDSVLDEILPVPELEDLKNDTVEQLRANGFILTNFHSGGIWYTLLMIILRMKLELTELHRTVLSNMFLSHSSGPWLDLKAADYGKVRKKAQKTKGYVTVSRSTGLGEPVKLARGHVFKTAKDINGEELRYFVLDNTVIPRNVGSVDVIVEAEKEGARYNVPAGQITRSLIHIGGGVDTISNGSNWVIREGSDTEDDDGLRTRSKRSWSELAYRGIADTYRNAAESVPGVLFAQVDDLHPRGQGSIDVIVTGTAGQASEALLKDVREAVDKISGTYDNILVKGSQTVKQPISVTVTTSQYIADEELKNRITATLTELLAIRKGRNLYELTLSDINHAIRARIQEVSNVKIQQPTADIVLAKDKVLILGDVSITIQRT